MAQARGSLRQVAFIAESVLGTTPVTPQTQLLEFVDFKGTLNNQQITDPSINAFRQKTFSRNGNLTAGGELDVVLCADNYDAFLESVFMGTWATNVLKVGTVATAVRRSFAVEEGFTDLVQYRTFNGMVVDTLNLTFGTDNLVRAKFGFIGTAVTAFAGTSIDSTPTAVTAKSKFFHDGGTFQVAGATVGYITSLEITLKNDYKATYGLGSSNAVDLPFGNAEITGKVTGMFDSIVEYNKFRSGTSSSISASVVASAESLTFLLPQIKYQTGNIVASGDAGVLVEFDFEAEYNTTETTAMKLTRV